jgi:23S rRNA (adenine-N6)-dimethyltransferase
VVLKNSQNFLHDNELVSKLINLANIKAEDTVLDIGAGKGIITDILAARCAKVIALELDSALFIELKTKFATISNVTVLNEDILNYSLPKAQYKVFSNIPFNLTSAIVNKLLFDKNPPNDSYLIMQKQAAQRFMGIGEGTLIAILFKVQFDLSIAYEFKRTDFRPTPAVDVVLVRARKLTTPLIPFEHMYLFRKFVAYIATQQRSSLKKRVKKIFLPAEYYAFCNARNLDFKVTLKELSLQDWIELFDLYCKKYGYKDIQLIDKAFDNYIEVKSNQIKRKRTKLYR